MSISNCDNIIDSRDVIARIEELETEQAALVEQLSNGEITESEMVAFDKVEGAELDSLRELAEQAEGYSPDWQYGATLIIESYFVEYCQQLVEDMGDIPSNLPSYLADNIDWEGVANDLSVDYTQVEFDGVTYYVR